MKFTNKRYSRTNNNSDINEKTKYLIKAKINKNQTKSKKADFLKVKTNIKLTNFKNQKFLKVNFVNKYFFVLKLSLYLTTYKSIILI